MPASACVAEPPTVRPPLVHLLYTEMTLLALLSRVDHLRDGTSKPTTASGQSNLAFGIDPTTGGVCGNPLCTADTAVEIYGGSPNYHDPYVYLYSLEVERHLPGGLIATVGYQGSVGHKLTRLVNQNFLQQPSNSCTRFTFRPTM